MITTHNLGFPRIGKNRELKFALEAYWKGDTDQAQLGKAGSAVRSEGWQMQSEAGVDLLPVGDFAWYDHVLATSLMLGAVPERHNKTASELDIQFSIARGKAPGGCGCAASEMTKWFNTNYHYIVPELTSGQRFCLNSEALFDQVAEANAQGHKVKPMLLGPVTFLHLAKCAGEAFDKLSLLDALLPVYVEIIERLSKSGVSWLQIDEPILTLELESEWLAALKKSFTALHGHGVNILLATYFDSIGQHLSEVANYPVDGIHLDTVAGDIDLAEVDRLIPDNCVLSLGVINGRNIWRSDLTAVYQKIKPLFETRKNTLWLAPSCSLLHVPVDLDSEPALDDELHSWLAFAKQKCAELKLLKLALVSGDTRELDKYSAPVKGRSHSSRVHNQTVAKRVAEINEADFKRSSEFARRIALQKNALELPLLPTTTIGSFPQTAEIRAARRRFKSGDLDKADYSAQMQAEIRRAIEEQEALGLDVLVHGEAERNDMVEYFGELLEGYAFTRFGWVQSYGSRCVKPPVIWGDVWRSKPMTLQWASYAASLTDKKVKGMLTGPVTMLMWSFAREDISEQAIATQIALALRDEVLDLEQHGVDVIQIDEPAFREGMPLKKDRWQAYLDWAAAAFRLCAGKVADTTQIHTHMCYAEFNDIIEAISAMDADVITIETARSDMTLLEAFSEFAYPNEIGPGVYDIHSPNVPEVAEIKRRMQDALAKLPKDRLWINPDCGLKTRDWRQTRAALANMVEAARQLRVELG